MSRNIVFKEHVDVLQAPYCAKIDLSILKGTKNIAVHVIMHVAKGTSAKRVSVYAPAQATQRQAALGPVFL
ncbi:MAG: hypothetical protein AAGJ35_07080 [Myxococcota bacterium]